MADSLRPFASQALSNVATLAILDATEGSGLLNVRFNQVVTAALADGTKMKVNGTPAASNIVSQAAADTLSVDGDGAWPGLAPGDTWQALVGFYPGLALSSGMVL